jgi:hypothetical protein
MWYPNRRQWVVVWVGVVLSALLWVPAVISGNSADERVAQGLIPVVVVVCVLLIWRFSRAA